LTGPRGYATLQGSPAMGRCSQTFAFSAIRLVSALGILCFLSTPSAAQSLPYNNDPMNDPHRLDLTVTYRTSPGTAVLLVDVFAESTRSLLDRQAVVKLRSLTSQGITWQTTDDKSLAAFTDVVLGGYEVEVSAVGYLSSRQELQIGNQVGTTPLQMVLQKDPAAVNLNVADSMPSKARKEVKRAVSALKSGNLKEAQKQLERAYGLVPSSPDLNFLLGYLYFQKKDFAQAGNYLGTATNLKPHDAQALTLLGRVGLEREDYPAARSALEQAVEADAENWLPRNLLADSYLRQRNYDKARQQAELAISKGKNKASPAQLVLGQALVGLGRDQDGIQALNTFLQDAPQNPIAPQVRSLITQIEQHKNRSTYDSAAQPSPPVVAISVSGVDPLRALAAPAFSLRTWQPAGIDEAMPSVAAGVVCPMQTVMDGSGARVQELVDDVSRIAAIEDLFHQSLDEMGNPIRVDSRKYNYVASIDESRPGFIAVDEYRGDRTEVHGFPDDIASTGFAALALVFHPHMREDFDMVCEGLGGWHGQATWLVHFRQRSDRPSRIHGYKVGGQIYPVSIKGRAWITSDKFQIVRIEADLVHSMPEIRLSSEHQIVDYGPVPFAKKGTDLWLPKSAEIYFEFRKSRYYRRHSFDHYMLFSVGSDEKRKELKATPVAAKPPA
jgi:tetratricopeptide (TPR) repeat protein